MSDNYGINVNGGTINARSMAAGENAIAWSADGEGLRATGPDEPDTAPETGNPDGHEGPVGPGHARHHTILVVDVEGFSNRRRTIPHQVAVREGLHRAMRKAFDKAGIPWVKCYREDRGDGALVLAPSYVPKSRFVESLPYELTAALCEHNEVYDARSRIRLRVALHAGEVMHDKQGVTGEALTRTFRLADAAALKSELAASPGVLALITSSRFFDEVVRQSAAVNPHTYREVEVAVKETRTTAWMHLPDPGPTR